MGEIEHIAVLNEVDPVDQQDPAPEDIEEPKPLWTNEEIRDAKMGDLHVGPVYEALLAGNRRPDWKDISHLSKESKTLFTKWDHLEIANEQLTYRKWEERARNKILLVVPDVFREEILAQLHDLDAVNHMGQKKTLARVTQRYYWPGMKAFTKFYVSTCMVCQTFKNPTKKPHAELKQYILGEPFERLGLDMIGPLPETERHNVWILTIVCYFTKYVEAIALPRQDARTVAKALMEVWVARLGAPREIHSDRGGSFTGEVFVQLCKLLGIRQSLTTSRRPNSNGMAESLNKTLERLLSRIIEENQLDWDEKLPYVLLAYRSSVHESTKETPFGMLFGREVLLPIDVVTPPPPGDEPLSVPQFVLDIQRNLRSAHEHARVCLQTAAVRQKRGYMTRFEKNAA